jgi:3-methyladenine DNA glycosylase/8-oxoguanine DNA glycosylase
MRALGFSHHKGLAIPDLATFLVREPAKLENLSTLDDQAAYEMLFGLCGVG